MVMKFTTCFHRLSMTPLQQSFILTYIASSTPALVLAPMCPQNPAYPMTVYREPHLQLAALSRRTELHPL
jgi:hypothetical protein